MNINTKQPTYKRILLKLSGEVLQGPDGSGIDATILNRIAKEIKELIELDIQVGVVIGGGNLFRGANLAKSGMNHVVGDYIGMLATIMNGLAMRDALCRIYVNVCLMSAIPLTGICDNYNWGEAINLLCNNHVVIFTAGTGNPFFTTDSAACLRGIEIEADVILKATKVDGVFTADPIKDPSAIMYNQLSYNEILNKELKVMDLAALTMARDHKLLIRIFNINKHGALHRAVTGKNEGTLITE